MSEPNKPRLLRETAEIALTEMKRFIEPKLMDDFSLRRVSAPLYLPEGSGLNDPGTAVAFTLEATGERMEIVTGLNRWLRSQLSRYEIAAGFGVFTVMNALRPELPVNAVSRPHVAAWAWQLALDADSLALSDNPPLHLREILLSEAKAVYRLLVATEKMILSRFPHLRPTLAEKMEIVNSGEIEAAAPHADPARQTYIFMRGHTPLPSAVDHPAVFVVSSQGEGSPRGEMFVWNTMVGCPLRVADMEALPGLRPSVGGNIYRDQLAMQLLHQTHLLGD